MEKQLNKVDLSIIRYSNVWEDADVLTEALKVDEKSSVLSIASAGDNCFALLAFNPIKLVAVDVSPVQLYLTELKAAGIKAFSREDFLSFIGIRSGARNELFQSLKQALSKECLDFWIEHENWIEEGLIHIGKFERYFQLFKNDYLHKVHGQSVIDDLLKPKSSEEQIQFHDEIWHTSEWIKLYKVFFGEKMLGDKGRDPEFLKHIQGSTADLILAQEVKHFRSTLVFQNYFLEYILNNRFLESKLPFYLREENYSKVKANIHKLELHQGFIEEIAKREGPFSHFNLSDIFEYMDDKTFADISRQLCQNSVRGAKFAYWNLMVPRDLATVNPAFHSKLGVENDLGYFYRQFVLSQYVG